TDLAAKGSSEDTKWFTILGSAPLRRVFEGAFNLPRSFAAIDLDQQVKTMKDKADRIFGSDTISQFTDPDKTEALIRRFLLQSEVSATVSPFARGAGALQLLQSTPQSAAAGVLSLLR
ncbi:MAG: DUF1217 domain-containing protein, partial [Sphingomonadales bacterium]|nr:DUF1217 domain-containing protein [Sphingomonadales bacterium]